ncbi:hypothetical protein SC206_08660 [Rouxiella sp. T17]|uniref:hypothetical protein n=1 Tax=Rouxiella sp. T17 TaxID=3085684 RepID=UPI002FC8FF59
MNSTTNLFTTQGFWHYVLTDKDAQQMLKQMENSKPNERAIKSLQEGRVLRQKMLEHG